MTDSAGYVDTPGDQSRDANQGEGNYREALPVGLMMWRDLPPERKQYILAQNPGVQGVPQLYDQTVMQSQKGPLTVPKRPEIFDKLSSESSPLPSANAAERTP
jgi:hypothetical protein